jgi:hypothetical protein
MDKIVKKNLKIHCTRRVRIYIEVSRWNAEMSFTYCHDPQGYDSGNNKENCFCSCLHIEKTGLYDSDERYGPLASWVFFLSKLKGGGTHGPTFIQNVYLPLSHMVYFITYFPWYQCDNTHVINFCYHIVYSYATPFEE